MDYMTCAFCENPFDNPLELDCLHVFCKKCIDQEMIDVEKNVVRCRLCSMETIPGNIQVNRLIALALQVKNLDQNSLGEDEDTIKEFETLASNLKTDVSVTPNPGEIVSQKRDGLRQSITEFYCNFISEVTTYLKEQSADILNELDSMFEKYLYESALKENRRQMLVEEIETLSKLFSNVFTDRTQLLMEDIEHEMRAYFGRCRSFLYQIGTVECNVNFLSGHEQKDLVLSTNFGALIDQTAIEGRSVETDDGGIEHIMSEPSTANTEENSFDERPSDNVINNVTDEGVTSEAYPLTESDENTANAEEIENQSQTIIEVTGNSTNSNDFASGAQSVQSPTNNINSITISPTDPQPTNTASNDTCTEEEPPPPYWMAVGEQDPCELSLSLSNIGNRDVNPRRSPRLSDSFTSSRSSSGSLRGQATNIPPKWSFNLQNQDSVHTSNPLQYATHSMSIRTHQPDDFRTGPIVAIAWLKDKLVLVDRFNSKVKMFLETGEFLHSLKFVDGEPWDVCAINVVEMLNNPLTCGLTIPRKRFVMLIQVVEGRTMLIGHRLATRRGYACLAYDQKIGTLVCGVSSPFGTPSIDIINTSGVLLAQFPLPQQILVRSIDVSIKDVIIICDWRKNKVLFLDRNGNIFGQYSGSEQCPLLEPVGTCTDGRGFLLVADSKSNTIHILTAIGKFYGIVKSSCPIIRPKEINVRPDGPPRLALSHGSMFVEVFDLFESEASPPAIPTAPLPQ